MSFGYSAGDFIAIGQLTWTVYKSCKGAPGEFQELARELSSLHTILHELEDDAKTPTSLLNRRGTDRKPELEALLENLSSTINKVDDIVKRYHSLGRDQKKTWDRVKFATKDLADLRSKIQLHITGINLFISSLSAGSLARIEGLLDELVRDIREGKKEPTIVSTYEDNDELAWDELERELVGDGITREDVRYYREEIRDYLRRLIEDDEDTIGPFESVSWDGDSGHSTPGHDESAPRERPSSVPMVSKDSSKDPGHSTFNHNEVPVSELPRTVLNLSKTLIPSPQVFKLATDKLRYDLYMNINPSNYSLEQCQAIVTVATKSESELKVLGSPALPSREIRLARYFARKMGLGAEKFEYDDYEKLGSATEYIGSQPLRSIFRASKPHSSLEMQVRRILWSLKQLMLKYIEISSGFRCLWHDEETEFFIIIVKLPLITSYGIVFQNIHQDPLGQDKSEYTIKESILQKMNLYDRYGPTGKKLLGESMP